MKTEVDEMSGIDARDVLFTLLGVEHDPAKIKEAVAHAEARLTKKDRDEVRERFKILIEEKES
ncbi:MAG: hypothetical protein FWG83_08030 [Oscillospiraceae bacterium]|nr:hypothetical protein [Oscillospiraceae bacterium]